MFQTQQETIQSHKDTIQSQQEQIKEMEKSLSDCMEIVQDLKKRNTTAETENKYHLPSFAAPPSSIPFSLFSSSFFFFLSTILEILGKCCMAMQMRMQCGRKPFWSIQVIQFHPYLSLLVLFLPPPSPLPSSPSSPPSSFLFFFFFDHSLSQTEVPSSMVMSTPQTESQAIDSSNRHVGDA